MSGELINLLYLPFIAGMITIILTYILVVHYNDGNPHNVLFITIGVSSGLFASSVSNVIQTRAMLKSEKNIVSNMPVEKLSSIISEKTNDVDSLAEEVNNINNNEKN